LTAGAVTGVAVTLANRRRKATAGSAHQTVTIDDLEK
jgi:hypothetical protein